MARSKVHELPDEDETPTRRYRPQTSTGVSVLVLVLCVVVSLAVGVVVGRATVSRPVVVATVPTEQARPATGDTAKAPTPAAPTETKDGPKKTTDKTVAEKPAPARKIYTRAELDALKGKSHRVVIQMLGKPHTTSGDPQGSQLSCNYHYRLDETPWGVEGGKTGLVISFFSKGTIGNLEVEKYGVE